MFSWQLFLGRSFAQGGGLLVKVPEEVIKGLVDLYVHVHNDVGFDVNATGRNDQRQQSGQKPGAFHGVRYGGIVAGTQTLFT